MVLTVPALAPPPNLYLSLLLPWGFRDLTLSLHSGQQVSRASAKKSSFKGDAAISFPDHSPFSAILLQFPDKSD